MDSRHLVSPLGILTAIAFSFALLNFVVKFINKKYIIKLDKAKNHFIVYYTKIMLFIVKNHKIAGITALIFMLLHFSTAFISHRIKITGIIAATIMLIIAILGIYAKLNKKVKGTWLTVHRTLAFILIVALIFHIL
ncbi:hypothetical protein [Clostridium sp.]|jgi:hypothetical protein|uniref:hypothetical protein n=1 Tax=Clostridium sp. TaxID=1506 RepID=UPI00258A215F|nr:hypothetical protein [Clostridium sp.]MDF2503433.1 hypothetical protein [Clostridium sp.]